MKRNQPKSTELNPLVPDEEVFSEVVQLIAASRQRAMQAVNTELIELYWKIGEIVSRKIKAAEWNEGWQTGWGSSSPERNLGCAALPAATSLEWDSSTRLIRTIKLCRHWCHNCPSLII
jgi:hypothetical protein